MSEQQANKKGTHVSFGIAFGIAIGILIGLLPKLNLIVLLLCLLLYFLRTNLFILLLSVITIIGFSLLAPFLDPIADQIGQFLLNIPAVQFIGSSLYASSFGPWTNIHNSIVLGQLVIGFILFFPVFYCIRKCIRIICP